MYYRRLFIIAVWIALGSPFAAAAQHREYLPLKEAETSNRFPVRHLGKLDVEHPTLGLPIGPAGAAVEQAEDESLVIKGKDNSAQAWTVRLAGKAPHFAYDVYVADLDKNGYQDALLAFPTGGNGLAPTAHIITVMFDSIGRPIFFEADGYFDYDEKGIPDLIDIDRDGKAELIYMNYDDGYWITNLYTAERGRWRRVKGQRRRRRYPLYTRFTYRPNHRPVTPRPDRHPFAPDLSNTSPNLRGRVVSFKWTEMERSGGIAFGIRTARGATITCEPESWFDSFSVLLDDRQGRRLISLAGSEDFIDELFKEMVRKGYTVALYGQRRAGRCSPEQLWVAPGAASR